MTYVTETLSAIERRADRAIVQELRLMTQEILAMRTHLSIEDRAHADALLLKLDHLARCQQVDTVPPPSLLLEQAGHADVSGLTLDTLHAFVPSAYLVHHYNPEAGDLECVELTQSLYGAVQLVHDRLATELRCLPVFSIKRLANGEIVFMSTADMTLASIVPTEPNMPDVAAEVANVCIAAQGGDLSALRRLFACTSAVRSEPLPA